MLSLLLLVLLLLNALLLLRSTQQVVVHLPPDVRDAAVLREGHIPLANIYAFAYSLFQSLNYWPSERGEVYAELIDQHHCLLTPRFIRWLRMDAKQKRELGESNRARGLFPLAGFAPEKVKTESADSWSVSLDFALKEWVRERLVKDTQLRYVLRVVRFPIANECNPWGLALDGHIQGPNRL